MSWQEDHERSVASFPEEIRAAHCHSSNHRAEIEVSQSCGCFYCCSIFRPAEIQEWVDENKAGLGQTALCPVCAIDSVLGDRSGFSLTPEFLHKMKHYWFDI